MAVFVSIVPQKYFVEKIGGNRVAVSVMVKPGASPATYEPQPGQMVQLTKAKLYFAIGVPFEKVWLKKIAAANPALQVVATQRGIAKISLPRWSAGDGTASGFGQESRDGGIKDPHIWLSPPLVKIQAHNIFKALLKIDPAGRRFYEPNFRCFCRQIDVLDAEIKHIFAGKKGLEFMVFHPSWGYFARTYGLVQIPIEIEGKQPKPAQLRALIGHARKRGLKVIFVQPQFSTRSAAMLAGAIGGRLVVADPLAASWAENLRRVAEKFKAALK